jgi:hypothetical protein
MGYSESNTNEPGRKKIDVQWGNTDTRRVSEKVHSMEIATPEPLVKAIALSVIVYDDARSRHDASGDINHFITPKAIDNDDIKARLRPKTQDSLDCFNTSRRTANRNKI